MKIGIDIRPLRDIMTGIGRYQYELLEALARIDSNNEYILFYNSLSPRIPEDLPRSDNFRLVFTRLPGKFLTALWAFTPLISVERFTGSINVFHSPSFQVPPARKAARVFTVFDLIALTYPEMAIPSAVRHFRPRVRHYAARADLIVAISKATGADVVRHLSVPEEKVVTVYPGTTPFERADANQIAATRRKYGIKGDYLLFVSRLDPRKNLSRLFKAFENSGLYRELELLVAGPEGWHMEEMFETWNKSKCKDKIRWLDYVNDGDLSPLYSGAMAFVYPSIVEGFGLPILEAMSVGCPVLTSDCSSMPEVAGDAALYVDPFDIDSISDGLLKIANDSDLRTRLSRSGKERVALFTWENTAENMIQVYGRASEMRRS